jgi:arsenite/tail-anchored protein-transporting ATPase
MHAKTKRGQKICITGDSRLSATLQAGLASRTKILLFGGKGGVGKTTVSAATALLLVKARERVLIISSDPAPSLSDIFETHIGGTIAEPVPGLQAIEIDAQQAVEKYKKRYGGVLVDILSTIVPVGPEILDDIPDDVAPGFDELFAIEEVLSYMGGDYDFIVWDTAPTGHTLRLLSLPDTIQNYATGMLAIHQRVEGVLSTIRTLFEKETKKDTIIETISELRDTAYYTRQILTDPGRSEFVPVIIPEALALYQTGRLKQTLDELGIPLHRMVVNGIVPENSCPFCMSRRSVQMKYLRDIRKQFESELDILEIPLFPGEMKGLDQLLQYAELLAKQPGFSGIGAKVKGHG